MDYSIQERLKVKNISIYTVLCICITFQSKYKQEHRPHSVPTLVSQEPSFYLKFLVNKVDNSKTIALRVMPLVLQLHLVLMSKYSKFGVDTFNTFYFLSNGLGLSTFALAVTTTMTMTI